MKEHSLHSVYIAPLLHIQEQSVVVDFWWLFFFFFNFCF